MCQVVELRAQRFSWGLLKFFGEGVWTLDVPTPPPPCLSQAGAFPGQRGTVCGLALSQSRQPACLCQPPSSETKDKAGTQPATRCFLFISPSLPSFFLYTLYSKLLEVSLFLFCFCFLILYHTIPLLSMYAHCLSFSFRCNLNGVFFHLLFSFTISLSSVLLQISLLFQGFHLTHSHPFLYFLNTHVRYTGIHPSKFQFI